MNGNVKNLKCSDVCHTENLAKNADIIHVQNAQQTVHIKKYWATELKIVISFDVAWTLMENKTKCELHCKN